MGKLMEKLYDNINDAKAFLLSFTNFVYMYDSEFWGDYYTPLCEECDNMIQSRDFLFPKANCQKPTGILDTFDFGVSPELRDDLIARFDVTEADFRPIRTKKGEIVYYQITPQHVMLPIHRENGWQISKICPQCGSIRYDQPRYYNSKNEPFYLISQTVLDDMHDFNVTYERFFRNRPIVIISRRVYDYLTECYPRTHYFPMFLDTQIPPYVKRK